MLVKKPPCRRKTTKLGATEMIQSLGEAAELLLFSALALTNASEKTRKPPGAAGRQKHELNEARGAIIELPTAKHELHEGVEQPLGQAHTKSPNPH